MDYLYITYRSTVGKEAKRHTSATGARSDRNITLTNDETQSDLSYKLEKSISSDNLGRTS